MDRRRFLRTSVVAMTAAGIGRALSGPAFAQGATPGAGPYGPLVGPDPNGLLLPEGFTSRIVARTGEVVAGTTYAWHREPDGAATFATEDGGWIYVSNSEIGPGGGVGAIRFDAEGAIVDAYRVLDDSSRNCAGGPTPWGTWLSCEEVERGLVWECDPLGVEPARSHAAMGRFMHEAAVVDPERRQVYLTEDRDDGLLYRYTPEAYPDLSAGVLQAMAVSDDGGVLWFDVPDPAATEKVTRKQVPEATRFRSAEGAWYDRGHVYFTTKNDDRIWDLDVAAQSVDVVYDGKAVPGPDRILSGGDNLIASTAGDLYVAEDGDNAEVVVLTIDRREVAAVVRVTDSHERSELTGLAFDPSGTRLYVSDQRGTDNRTGRICAVTGPWRQAAAAAAPTPTPTASVSPSALPTVLASPAPAETAAAAQEPTDGGSGALPVLGAAAGAAVATGGALWALDRRRRPDEDPPA